MLPADWSGSSKTAAASAEEEQVPEDKKLELAEARIKKLEEDRKTFIESDVERFLSSDQATKKIPLAILKAGNLKRLLLAAANTDGPIKLAAADGTESDSTLYEGMKAVLLALPDKLAGVEEEVAKNAEAADENDEVKQLRMAGIDEQSARLDFAARKLQQAEKTKGIELGYLEAVRRVSQAK